MTSPPTASRSGIAALHDADRAAVRIAPGDRRAGVHHRGDSRGDERLARDAVDVAVIDDGDLAASDALGEILRAPVDSRDSPHDLGCGLHPAAQPHRARTFSRSEAARSSSSPACARACAESRSPASIRASSATRASSRSRVAPARVRPFRLGLDDRDVGVGKGRDLRKVRHAEHLVLTSQPGEGSTHCRPRFAADARRRPRRTPASAVLPTAPHGAPASRARARRRTRPWRAAEPARPDWEPGGR